MSSERLPPDPFDLSGKTALVTGCRRGIGEAVAVALARAGADIVGVSASLDADDDVATEIIGLGRDFRAYRCELGDRRAVHELAARLAAAGLVDVVETSSDLSDCLTRDARPPAFDSGEPWLGASLGAYLASELGEPVVSRDGS